MAEKSVQMKVNMLEATTAESRDHSWAYKYSESLRVGHLEKNLGRMTVRDWDWLKEREWEAQREQMME